MSNDYEFVFIDYLKDLFRKKRIPQVGDMGIYKDVLTITTINDGTHALYYDIYAKVRVIGAYNNLVELEIISITTLNASNNDITSVINANIPKYLHPKYVRWEIKN